MKQLYVKNWDFEKRLSPHFKLGEFIVSEIAYKQKLLLQYVHQPDVMENIQYLVDNILEPVRKKVNQPIIITSGYRCRPLNTLCSGASGSMHLQGLAADIYVYNEKLKLVRALRDLDFNEIIIHPGYIHVSIHRAYNRGLYLNETSDRSFDFK